MRFAAARKRKNVRPTSTTTSPLTGKEHNDETHPCDCNYPDNRGLGLTHALAGPNTAPPVLMAKAARGGSHDRATGHSGAHRHGRWHRRDGKDHGRFCGGIRGGRLDQALVAVEEAAGFTPPQSAAWSELEGEIRAAGISIKDACGDAADPQTAAVAPHRLARLEILLTVGLASLRRVRPAFERLYATLSEAQKVAFDSLITGNRHH